MAETMLYRHWNIVPEGTDEAEVHSGHLVRPTGIGGRIADGDGSLVVCVDDGDQFWAFTDELHPVAPPEVFRRDAERNPVIGLMVVAVFVALMVVVGLLLGWLIA